MTEEEIKALQDEKKKLEEENKRLEEENKSLKSKSEEQTSAIKDLKDGFEKFKDEVKDELAKTRESIPAQDNKEETLFEAIVNAKKGQRREEGL